jgi:hypothetical protein
MRSKFLRKAENIESLFLIEVERLVPEFDLGVQSRLIRSLSSFRVVSIDGFAHLVPVDAHQRMRRCSREEQRRR